MQQIVPMFNFIASEINIVQTLKGDDFQRRMLLQRNDGCFNIIGT